MGKMYHGPVVILFWAPKHTQGTAVGDGLEISTAKPVTSFRPEDKVVWWSGYLLKRPYKQLIRPLKKPYQTTLSSGLPFWICLVLDSGMKQQTGQKTCPG